MTTNISNLIVKPPLIDFQIEVRNFSESVYHFIENSKFVSDINSDFYIELFKYIPYAKNKYNSAQIQFIRTFMNNMTVKEFAETQHTSEKAIRKILYCPPHLKVDLNWISEKHLRETAYLWYDKLYSNCEYKDRYYNLLHFLSYVNTKQTEDYNSNIIIFDYSYRSKDNRFKYFYQEK